MSWVFFTNAHLKVIFAQFLDFTACFGHMVLLFSFSYEGHKNLSGTKAEGRGTDSDMSLRDDVVRIYGKYCQAGGGTGTLLGQQGSVWL